MAVLAPFQRLLISCLNLTIISILFCLVVTIFKPMHACVEKASKPLICFGYFQLLQHNF